MVFLNLCRCQHGIAQLNQVSIQCTQTYSDVNVTCVTCVTCHIQLALCHANTSPDGKSVVFYSLSICSLSRVMFELHNPVRIMWSERTHILPWCLRSSQRTASPSVVVRQIHIFEQLSDLCTYGKVAGSQRTKKNIYPNRIVF